MKKNGKYCNGKKSLNMKPLALLLALVMLVGCVVGGTIAWLTAQTAEVKNTFTVGDINIKLEEASGSDYHYVPGATLTKNPIVTVLGGTVDCEAHYLFVKIKVANNNITVGANTEAIVNFAVASGWTYYGQKDGDTIKKGTAPAQYVDGTYYFYMNNAKTTTDDPYHILADDQVTINTNVTKNMYGTLSADATKPVVSFWAAAVQSENLPAVASKTAEDVAFGLITWPDET